METQQEQQSFTNKAGLVIEVGEEYLRETPTKRERVLVYRIEGSTIYAGRIERNRWSDSGWGQPDPEWMATKMAARTLIRTWAQEEHLNSPRAFWQAKAAGRSQVAQQKEARKRYAITEQVKALPEVQRFVEDAEYLAKQLEERARDIRHQAERIVESSGREFGWGHSWAEEAGDLLAEFSGSHTGYSHLVGGGIIAAAEKAEKAATEFRSSLKEEGVA